MENIIQESRPIISICFGDMDIDGGLSARDLTLYLENKGYTAYEFSGIGFIKHSLKERYNYDNILFYRNLKL